MGFHLLVMLDFNLFSFDFSLRIQILKQGAELRLLETYLVYM